MAVFFEDKVYLNETKSVFHEVTQCFYAGCFRSAMVSLWTVIIFDILKKLEYAENTFNDENAKIILKKINNLRKKDKYSSKWEIDLLDELKEKNIISIDLVVNLESLKSKRNLCAHPELINMNQLYNPTKEEVYSYIEFFCNSLFSSNYFVSKNFDFFIKEISNYNIIFQNKFEDINIFLNKQYYIFLSKPAKISYFKNLWKFCFKLNNEEADVNRINNITALMVLYESDKQIFINEFKNNINTYINIDMSYNILRLLCINIFVKYPELFTFMHEHIKISLKNYCKNNFLPLYSFCFEYDEYIKLFFEQESNLLVEYSNESVLILNSMFQYKDKEYLVNTILNNLKIFNNKNYYWETKKITDSILINIDKLFAYSKNIIEKNDLQFSFLFSEKLFDHLEKKEINMYLKNLINIYSSSSNYNEADLYFEEFVLGYINKYYDLDLINYFINKIWSNDQCCGRRKSKNDHQLIKEKFINVEGVIDLYNEKHSNVFR